MTIHNILPHMVKTKSSTDIHKQQRVVKIIIMEYVLGSKSYGQIQNRTLSNSMQYGDYNLTFNVTLSFVSKTKMNLLQFYNKMNLALFVFR
jgi:hypothetical protein